MSRSLYVYPLVVLMLAACGDPYAAPKTDGGTASDGAFSRVETGEEEDTGEPREPGKDSGTRVEDEGTPGDPCTTSGKIENLTCGNCGKRVRVCGSDLKWSEWSACEGEGVCSPGAKESEACGTSGMRARSCSGTCSWGSFGECVGDAPTCGFIGKTESEACGNCGTRTRTCAASGWGTWGACTGEGVCAPGATESLACTTGGTKSRTCSTTCTWGTYGTCTGATTTACAAGATPRQTFSSSSFSGMWGCAGKVSWATADTLCAPTMHLCTAAEFQARRGFTTPSHHYWTDDYMAGSGTEGACKASKTLTGNFCPSSAPMRVCGSSKTDTSGNYCTWVSCGYESTSSSLYWGGCNDDGLGGGLTAGAVCCN
jgi:hypothetical protein